MKKIFTSSSNNLISIHTLRCSRFILAALVMLTVFANTVMADGEISEASFEGRYAGAITGFGGKRPVAIAGILTFRGDGTGTADTVWNLPGARFTDRKVIPVTFDFIYEVDENGFGVLKAETFADIHFVATRSKRRSHGNALLATEIQSMAARFEIDGGNLLIGTGKRLPNRAEFDERSLKGMYGGLGVGEGGRLLTSIGYLNLFGNGAGSELSLWNLPDPGNVQLRKLEFLPSTFSYKVNPNGLGVSTALLQDGTELDNWFVITKTKRRGGRYLADEILVIQNELDPLTGDLILGHIKRIY